MDTVLGVSITRISAGLVLLEGRIPDGVTVDRDAIDLSGSHASMTDVMAAVLGIQGSVSAKGHRLRAVGVTWSAGSEPKARELVTTLTEFGLTNIVTVRPSEATRTLTRNSRGVDADTATPVVDIGGDDVAAANSEVPLARGAALALARQETAETEHDENLSRERRRPDPSTIAAATILCGGTLAVLAAIWIGVAPRHADSDVGPPAPQQQSAPPPLQVPPPAPATASPAARATRNARRLTAGRCTGKYTDAADSRGFSPARRCRGTTPPAPAGRPICSDRAPRWARTRCGRCAKPGAGTAGSRATRGAAESRTRAAESRTRAAGSTAGARRSGPSAWRRDRALTAAGS